MSSTDLVLAKIRNCSSPRFTSIYTGIKSKRIKDNVLNGFIETFCCIHRTLSVKKKYINNKQKVKETRKQIHMNKITCFHLRNKNVQDGGLYSLILIKY
jgi:hypothetical protein